jgi:N-acyl-L-homoserine lactone synthetase
MELSAEAAPSTRPVHALVRTVLRPWAARLLHRSFVPEEATTAHQRAEAFRIRHEVYCRELAYEDPEASPLGQETDDADEHARHCLLWHRPTERYAGCVRVVSAGNEGGLLPIERTCAGTLAPDWCERRGLDRRHVAEISRLALRPAFRAAGARPPLLPASLLLSLTAAACAINHGLDAVALMRPAFARRLCRQGLAFEQIGPPIEHRGLRAPYVCTRVNLRRGLGVLGSALLDVLRSDLADGRLRHPPVVMPPPVSAPLVSPHTVTSGFIEQSKSSQSMKLSLSLSRPSEHSSSVFSSPQIVTSGFIEQLKSWQSM